MKDHVRTWSNCFCRACILDKERFEAKGADERTSFKPLNVCETVSKKVQKYMTGRHGIISSLKFVSYAVTLTVDWSKAVNAFVCHEIISVM